MHRRHLALALVPLALAGSALALQRWRSNRARETRASLTTRWLRSVAKVEGCAAGPGPFPSALPSLESRTRRMMLGAGDPRWPRSCADEAGALARAAGSRTGDPLASALSLASLALGERITRDERAVAAFREGQGGAPSSEWASALSRLHQTAVALGAREALDPLPPARTSRVPFASVTGDLLPVTVDPGGSLAGWSYSSGTFSSLFIEPQRGRLFCRSRDRGGTLSCRRLEASLVTLVPNTGPEALVLAEHRLGAEAPSRWSVEAVDVPGVPAFAPTAPPARSLALTVTGSHLFAFTSDATGSYLERLARGGGARVREPSGVEAHAEAAMLTAGEPPRGFFLALSLRSPPSLVARELSTEGARPAGPSREVAPSGGPTSLLLTCTSGRAAYAAVVGAERTELFSVEGAGPRSLGRLATLGLPASLACDEEGATLSGPHEAQSCGLRGGCGEPRRLDRSARLCRVGGSLVAVTRAQGGGLRVRTGRPEEALSLAPLPLADDAAHGGADALSLWCFPLEGRLLLVAAGALTTVLYSDDRGRTWRATREAAPDAPRPRRELPSELLPRLRLR